MIQAVNLTVGAGAFSLAEINFTIPAGQYAVLMGDTGSGKTTLLETICGLKRARGGSIYFAERDITRLKPADRGIGYVPQDGALFETMTVRDHLEFAMRIRGWRHDLMQDRVNQVASLVGVDKLLNRRPHGLSGGESQRVSLGRALSFRPSILCLDEPLSALDDDSRQAMMRLLKKVQQETGVTVLHVTHNRAEAEELADFRLRVKGGRVLQPESFLR